MTPTFSTRTLFVQIKCAPGAAYRVAAALVDTLEGQVSEVYSTSGAYDLLCKVALGGDQDPGLFVTSRIQPLEGVRETYTLLAFNAFTPAADPA